MQLTVYIDLKSPLTLPVNYNHILQAVIYQGLGKVPDFGNFLHEEGYIWDNGSIRCFSSVNLLENIL